MFDVILSIKSGDVRSTERILARETDQAQTLEVVSFAEGVLVGTFIGHREELGGNNFVAFLYSFDAVSNFAFVRRIRVQLHGK